MSEAPLLSDGLLRRLADPTQSDVLGEWDEETRALLGTAIPEMAKEILQRRADAAQLKGALILSFNPAFVGEMLNTARKVVRSSDICTHRELAAACHTLVTHSPDAFEREAAADVIAQLQEAA